MAHNVYIQGLSGAGFRAKVVGGSGPYKQVKEKVNVQVDLDDHRTQLRLSSERNFGNFIRTSGSGATTATIVGLSRRGFRIPRQSDGHWVVVKVGSGVTTVDLNSATVRRILYRSKRDWISASSATQVAVYGIMNEQNGFDISLGAKATAVLSSDGTNPVAGDTVTINDKTYRFESTLALANDVKIGASSDATLDSLVKAVNQTGVVGTDYFTGTTAPTGVTAGARTGTGATGQVTFTATAAGSAANSYASTETSAHLSFGAATFTGGGGSVGNSSSINVAKVYRGQSFTIDATQPFNYQQLRRYYDRWVEA